MKPEDEKQCVDCVHYDTDYEDFCSECNPVLRANFEQVDD